MNEKMPKENITLSINKDLIHFAEQYSVSRRITIDEYISALVTREMIRERNKERIEDVHTTAKRLSKKLKDFDRMPTQWWFK